MKTKVFQKILSIACISTLMAIVAVGCGCKGSDEVAKIPLDTVEDNIQEKEPIHFTKGVYANYSLSSANSAKSYFYIFYDENSGYTADGRNGIGLPFSCAQQEDSIIFHFGGEDDYGMVLNISSDKDGVINGMFDNDGNELVFERINDVSADNFDAVAYANNHDEVTYSDPNGWRVKYDPDLFEVNSDTNIVSFVYMGESAGTNMITATYVADKDAESTINELAGSWGTDVTNKARSIFPGTEDIDGYWAYVAPMPDSSGLYMTAVARDYKNGTLIFELTGHNGDDDEMNMEVSDYLSMIIDSLEFV